jgi:hypothetical protein
MVDSSVAASQAFLFRPVRTRVDNAPPRPIDGSVHWLHLHVYYAQLASQHAASESADLFSVSAKRLFRSFSLRDGPRPKKEQRFFAVSQLDALAIEQHRSPTKLRELVFDLVIFDFLLSGNTSVSSFRRSGMSHWRSPRSESDFDSVSSAETAKLSKNALLADVTRSLASNTTNGSRRVSTILMA